MMTKFQVSEGIIVRWQGDQFIILHRKNYLEIRSNDERLLTLLHQFRKPKAIESVDPDETGLSKQEIQSVTKTLIDKEILVAESEKGQSNQNLDQTEVSDQISRLLENMAINIDDLSGDVAAFGSKGLLAMGSAKREELLEKLTLADESLFDVLRMCRAHRSSHLEAQKNLNDITPTSKNLHLHLGCGKMKLDGWINIDFAPADFSMNLRWGLPFSDSSAKYVYLSHVFEHLYYPRDALHLLKDVHRVLEKNGVFRIIVPDIERCIRAYVENDEDFFNKRKSIWKWAQDLETKLELFLQYAGAPDGPGAFGEHKYGYDFETLQNLLRKAGFNRIRRSDFMKSEHSVFSIENDASVTSGEIDPSGRHYSLFIEAQK